jgi:LuxR family transcriptional regulator, glucitol operon activator
MGPFARSYLTRIEKFKPDEARKIIERSRKVTATYQEELGNSTINKYSFEHYTVRSHSETIAASHLRRAFRAANRGDIDGAMKTVDALRISVPEYFELYRVRAAIHVKENDLQAAISDYDTAIDVDPKQPQLYFWYGGFLMRYLNDFDGASNMFMKALEMDPNSGAVLREAARNEFFACRFEKAQELVDKAMELEQKSFKDNVIFSDLQAQIYIRTAHALAQAGDFVGAVVNLEKLRSFIESLDESYMDATFRDHVEKAKRYCTPILIQSAPDNIKNRVQSFLGWLDTLLVTPVRSDLKRQIIDRKNGTNDIANVDTSNVHVGQLKKLGQQPTFGFLVTEDGIEAFVHRSLMPYSVWMFLNNGGSVRFRMAIDDSGRLRATDLDRI